MKENRLAIRSKTLASMLAQEDLRVTFDSHAQTAYFNSDQRELVLPHWDLDNQCLVDMLVEHEVGHAIHSGGIDLASVSPELRGYVNILEDVRVDRLQRENYPGTKKDYFEAGKALIERDVFKLKEMDLNTALLVDRINLKSKIGLHIGVPFFSEEEKDFVVRAFATQTAEDVLALAKEMFEYDSARREEDQQAPGENSEEQEDGEQMTVPSTGGASEETQDEGTTDQTPKRNTQKEDQDSSNENNEKKEEQQDSKESREDSANDASGEKKADKGKEEEQEDAAPEKVRNGETPKPQTSDSLDDFERDANRKNWRSYENSYFNIGDVPLECAFLRPDLFRQEVEEVARKMDYIPDYVAEHEKLYKDAIALLRKEFAVHRFARSTSSLKTMKGSINTNALCLYKINDNIFRKSISIEKNDNNHRIVFMVDNSGSMYGNEGMQTVLKQIVIFRRFCLEEKIPFHVISFTSPGGYFAKGRALQDWYDRQAKLANGKDYESSEYWLDQKALLIEILNENDSNDYFNKLVAYIDDMRKGYYAPVGNAFRPANTPTNNALSRLYPWLIEVKKTMREDKLDLVILTDGEATDSIGYAESVIVRDAITKREYNVDDIYENTSRYMAGTKLMPGFVVLKSLKEEKILNCVVWYNFSQLRSFREFDFGYGTMRKIAMQITKTVDAFRGYSKIMNDLRKVLRSEGVVCAQKPFTFIDIAYFFISPNVFMRCVENDMTRKGDKDSVVFRAERKAATIFKSLAGNCAKFLG